MSQTPMELELVRDKVAEFLIIREIANLRIASRHFRQTELKLKLHSVPRRARTAIVEFLPDEWSEDIVETCFERLAVASRDYWYAYRNLTRNYLKFA